jgi:uncharacterized repeat protein (TIGR02543 family)
MLGIRRYLAVLLTLALTVAGLSSQVAPAQAATTGDASTVDYALSLNGTSDYLQASEGSAFTSRSVYTVEIWAKPNAGNCSSASGVYCTVTSHDGDWWIGVHNGVYKYLVYYAGQGVNSGYISSGVPAVANSWAHLSLVRNDTSVSFYVDNQLAVTTTVSSGRSTYSGYPINVGWHYGAYFAGQVDELKIWSTARTSSEMLSDMHNYQTSPASTANLISYWDFNEGGSNTTINNRVLTASTNLSFINASPVANFVDVKTTSRINGKTVITFPRSYLTPVGGWTVPAGYGRAEALIVAGGGGGGSRHAGGGGAGELMYLSNYAPSASSVVAVKVGQGGRGMTATTTNSAMAGQPGQTTTFAGINYLGGGAGAGGTATGTSGGSGGGLAGGGTAIPAGAGSGLKNAGGIGGFSGSIYAGGGGGGAGGAGSNAATVNSVFKGGDGGAGYQSSITGTLLCYASGGGAGAMSANVGVGGACANSASQAGSGSYNTAATSAIANSGSGGGAGGFDGTTNQAAGNGGSGVVVVSYSPTDDKVINFTGATTYASTTSQIFPASTAQDYTFEIWIKPNSFPANHQPIATSDSNMATRFYLGTNNTTGTSTSSQVHVGIGNAFFNSARSIRASEWTHLAVTVSSTTVSLYINGYLDSTSTMSRVAHSAGLQVGSSTNTGTTQFFDGQVDQVKIWNSALSASQLSRSMHAYGDSDATQIASTLQHAWDFNVESSSTYPNINGGVSLTKNGLPTLTSLATTTVVAPNTRVVFDRTFLTPWGGWVSNVLSNNGYLSTVLVVGGGGGAGKGTMRTYQPAGAGGGGGVTTLNSQALTAGGIFAVKVGAGAPGAIAIADDASTRNGQSSAFNTTTVLGGGGGGSYGYTGAGGAVATGGGGGGLPASGNCTTNGAAGGVANSGLNGSLGVWGWGGGGGGAGGVATNGSCATNYGTAGVGVSSSLTGTAVEYGRGGFSYANASSTVLANTGTGGNVQYNTAAGDGSGTDGASGKVVISFRSFWVMSYEPNGGTGTQADSYISWPTSCQNLTSYLGVTFTRPGYNFAGWKTGNVGIGTTGSCTQPGGDRLWSAQWSDNPYVNLDAASTTSLPITGATWTSNASLAPLSSTLASTAISGQTYTAGPPNSLALPDGAAVNMGANNLANIAGAITVEVWAKCSAYRSGTGNNVLASKWYSTTAGAAATGNDWLFGISNDRLTLSTTSSANLTATTPWDSTKCSGWTNYAFTLDPANNNTLTFYINGVADGSYTGVTHTTFANTILQIGDGRTGQGFQGFYSKFRFYNLALSAAQMSAKYTADVPYFAETFTTTYSYAGANGGTMPASSTYTAGGAAITLPTPTKTGYTFAGWYSDAGFTTSIGAAGASYSPTSNTTAYAKWTGNSLAVTYNSNGGSSVAAGTTTSGATIASAPSDPTKSGYVFAGWYLDAGLTNQAVFPNFAHGQLAPFTLYAKWTAGTYVITFTYNGATGGNGSASASFTTGGAAISLPTPTKTGYTFAGWFAEPGFTTQVSGPQSPTSDATLYAKWAASSFTLTYSYNGATGGNGSASASFTTGGSAISLPTPTKTGYTFAGWFAEPGFTTQVSGPQSPSADATLYAKWAASSFTLTYSYNGATGGNGSASASFTTGGAAISLPTPTKTGYTFAGWFAEPGFTTQVSGPQSPTSDATLYAKWASAVYTMNFAPNYGVQSNSVATVAMGNATTLPTPTRSNFVFDGWYTASTGGTKVGVGGASYTPSADTTLYARWIQSSLVGVIGSLARVSTITASNIVDSTYTGSTGSTGMSVSVPHGSLPSGTFVNIDLITDTTYASSIITGVNNYVISLAVSWIAPDETVPDTNPGTAVSLTLTNANIRAGAQIYALQNGVATLVGTATANGTVTVLLTSDPSIYIVQRAPGSALSLTSNVTTTSGTVTWSAPSSDGGSAITGYTVTLSSGATCTTLTLSCEFLNLNSGATYTANIVATNGVGSSQASTITFTTTSTVQPAPQPTPSPTPQPTPDPVVPDPTPEPTPDPVDPKPVVVSVPAIRAVTKVLAYNVPVLTGVALIKPIDFAPNSAKLDRADIAKLEIAAGLLKEKTGWLLVTGFVKYTATTTKLMRSLAAARAKNVALALSRLGVKVKIGYLGYGPQNTKSPKNSDRKVELRWVETKP